MATYAKLTYSAASYAAFRPTYPPSLYNAVLAYHRGPKSLCLDLGTGPGLVARAMATRFDRVIGTDPSPVMIKQAREKSVTYKNIEFHQGRAESSPFIPASSVDCIVAGQAAHWFDYATLWPEMYRILRPGGTLAFWGYKDAVLVDFAPASRILDAYTYDNDLDRLGPYWSQPGRSYLQNKLRIIQPPAGEWGDTRRLEYEPACRGPRSGDGTVFVERRLSVGEMKAYYRTFSAYHDWREAHPEEQGQVARSKGGEGDVIDRMVDEIAQGEAWFRDESNMVNMEWGTGLVMCRRV